MTKFYPILKEKSQVSKKVKSPKVIQNKTTYKKIGQISEWKFTPMTSKEIVSEIKQNRNKGEKL